MFSPKYLQIFMLGRYSLQNQQGIQDVCLNIFINSPYFFRFEGDGPIYVSILILLAIACLFTIAGGLTAVIWTDFIQTILMIIGALVLAILGIELCFFHWCFIILFI